MDHRAPRLYWRSASLQRSQTRSHPNGLARGIPGSPGIADTIRSISLGLIVLSPVPAKFGAMVQRLARGPSKHLEVQGNASCESNRSIAGFEKTSFGRIQEAQRLQTSGCRHEHKPRHKRYRKDVSSTRHSRIKARTR